MINTKQYSVEWLLNYFRPKLLKNAKKFMIFWKRLNEFKCNIGEKLDIQVRYS